LPFCQTCKFLLVFYSYYIFFFIYPPKTVDNAIDAGFVVNIACCARVPDITFAVPATATLNVITNEFAFVTVINLGNTITPELSHVVTDGYKLFKLCVTVQVVADANV